MANKQKNGTSGIVIVMALIFFAFPKNCPAEPIGAMKYLMNEPVSMLDWGIYRMENALEAAGYLMFLEINKVRPTIQVHYDGDSNRIIIEIRSSLLEEGESQTKAKEWCKAAIELSRVTFGINTKTGKAISSQGSHVGNFFRYEGHQRKNQPDNLGNELDAITDLVVIVQHKEQGTDAPPKTIRCKAPLLGTEIMFLE